jgi:hypothetical protein
MTNQLKFLPEFEPAILAGQKTQHREPLEPQPPKDQDCPRCEGLDDSLSAIEVNWLTSREPESWLHCRPAFLRGDRFQVQGVDFEITHVRVERVGEISEEDAKAEGCDAYLHATGLCTENPRHYYIPPGSWEKAFARLWDSICGDGAFQANGWVWVYTFKRVEGQQGE